MVVDDDVPSRHGKKTITYNIVYKKWIHNILKFDACYKDIMLKKGAKKPFKSRSFVM